MSTYQHEGIELPSVTTILGIAGHPPLQWSANCVVDYLKEKGEHAAKTLWYVSEEDLEEARFHYKTISDQAMHDGSAVHNAINKFYLCGEGFTPENKEQENAYNQFLKWHNTYKPIVKETEHTLYADDYAGTCDLIAEIDGKVTLVDFKTSAALYPKDRYQIAAYRVIANTDAGVLVRLPKDGKKFQHKVCNDYEQDLKCFILLKEYYFASKPKIRKQFEEQKRTSKTGLET